MHSYPWVTVDSCDKKLLPPYRILPVIAIILVNMFPDGCRDHSEQMFGWSENMSKVYRVTTCMENLEMSGNLTAVTEMSGIFTKSQAKYLVREKLPKTVYC